MSHLEGGNTSDLLPKRYRGDPLKHHHFSKSPYVRHKPGLWCRIWGQILYNIMPTPHNSSMGVRYGWLSWGQSLTYVPPTPHSSSMRVRYGVADMRNVDSLHRGSLKISHASRVVIIMAIWLVWITTGKWWISVCTVGWKCICWETRSSYIWLEALSNYKFHNTNDRIWPANRVHTILYIHDFPLVKSLFLSSNFQFILNGHFLHWKHQHFQ